MQAEHLKALTGLRFWAAMWVVAYHFWPRLAAPSTPMVVEKGYLGVELFFVLSGFILCHVYLPQAAGGRFRYGAFLWARLARVYPLHLVTLGGVGLLGLAAVVAGMGIDGNILAWEALAANLLLVHAWGFAPVSGWNHPSWSVSAEWFAYLSFPLFAWLTLKARGRPLTAAVAALAALFWAYVLFERLAGFPLTQATIQWGALRIIPCFAYGCAIYLAWSSGVVGRRTPAALGAAFSGAAVIATAAAGAPDAIIVGLFGPLILCLAALTSTGSPLGGNKLSVYLGEISYSVYMVCIPWSLIFFNAVPRLIGSGGEQLPWHIWIFGLLGVIPIAAASYHLVEKPARQAMRGWSWPKLSRDVKTTA